MEMRKVLWLTPIPAESGGGGFGPSMSFGTPDVALIMSVIYVIVSLIIIVRKYATTRSKSK